MRKLASIVKVSSVREIPRSDRLSVAEMEGKGWQVVVDRGSLKSGDTAVYFEIDSALPADDVRYAFLKDRCLKQWKRGEKVLMEVIRIKTIRLRGTLSQGVLLPISQFPELKDCTEGTDVTNQLHVQHYDEISLPFQGNVVQLFSGSRGPFPLFIPKTDEERIQNLDAYFETMKGRCFEITAKDDGTSMTAYYSPSMHNSDPFRVCSRNYDLKPDEPSSLWEIARKYRLEEKLKSTSRELAFQGELVGPGINGNNDLYPSFEWHVFRIWDISRACYLEARERRNLCAELGIPHVQVIDTCCRIFDCFSSMEKLLTFAEGKTLRGHEREGLVCKETGTEHPVTFKVVSNRYLLKHR